MIESFWFSNGITVWFRYEGKVYTRKILKTNKWLMPQITFKGDKYHLPNALQRLDIEEIINPYKYAVVCINHRR